MSHDHLTRKFSDASRFAPSYPSQYHPHTQLYSPKRPSSPLPPPPLSSSVKTTAPASTMPKRRYTSHERHASYELIDDLLKQSYDELQIRCDARIILASNESMKLVAEPVNGTEDIDLDLVDYEALEEIVRDGEYDQPYWYSEGVKLMFRKVEGARRRRESPPRSRERTRESHDPKNPKTKQKTDQKAPDPAPAKQPEPSSDEAAENRKRDKVFTYGPGLAVAVAGVLGALAAR